MKAFTIMVSGKQGSGKSSLISQLMQYFKNAGADSLGFSRFILHEYAFASPLYAMQEAIQTVCVEYGLPKFGKNGALLQYLGTEFGRKQFGDNVWSNVVHSLIDDQNHVNKIRKGKDHDKFIALSFISDLRFKNEANSFPEAIKIRLECPEEVRKERILATPGQNWRANSSHQSEIDLDDYTGWDRVIDTNENDQAGTLRLAVETVYERVLSEKI